MSDHATPDDPPEPPRELWGLWSFPDGSPRWSSTAHESGGSELAVFVGAMEATTAAGYDRDMAEAFLLEPYPVYASLIGVHPDYRSHLRTLLSAAQSLLSGSGQEDAARRRLREAARAAGEFGGGDPKS